ncbi:alpha/beta hydrolase [Rhodoferax ferrireducens]|uniref:alpha/beta hydrolase n=1 Tax=Rhodoferax ferrireducens TaxID=192843 RepID=UPI001E41D6E1|nr:alpha/beta hydrolase [Rhodoferax ferrireducens]
MTLFPTRVRHVSLVATLLFLATLAGAAPAVPDGVRRIADLPYGQDERQRMDVYLPPAIAAPGANTPNAPILVMVHGGAWMVGNKAMPKVVENKVAWWVKQKGYIFVSVGYRLSPQVDPLVQARDVAGALAKTQALAASWGGRSGESHSHGAFGRCAPGGFAGRVAGPGVCVRRQAVARHRGARQRRAGP